MLLSALRFARFRNVFLTVSRVPCEDSITREVLQDICSDMGAAKLFVAREVGSLESGGKFLASFDDRQQKCLLLNPHGFHYHIGLHFVSKKSWVQAIRLGAVVRERLRPFRVGVHATLHERVGTMVAYVSHSSNHKSAEALDAFILRTGWTEVQWARDSLSVSKQPDALQELIQVWTAS